MSFLLSFLGGSSAKIYDDLNDNECLKQFYNNTFMEFLKGIHFILFTAVSIHEPLFFYIFYAANILNYLSNTKNWNFPYELSLIFSFFILFFIIDYKKVNNIKKNNKIFFGCMILAMFTEPLFMYYLLEDEDYSFKKITK